MIAAYHGFLGERSDWDFFREEFSKNEPERWHCPSFFSSQMPGLLPSSLCDLASSENAWLTRQDTKPHVFMGYSWGGRLALHMALQNPELVSQLILVSSGWGFEGDQLRSERRRQDEVWAQKFETMPWGQLLQEWAAQGVFRGRPLSLDRPESHFSRRRLAQVLRDHSPAVQNPLRSRIHEIKCPILWIVGEQDPAYRDIADKAKSLMVRGRVVVVPGAGHRIPWEAPDFFKKCVREFLQR
jgi:2-succinyl-6-hydroxy-2,4-cyclohexadiene-1-carboxylate synthase